MNTSLMIDILGYIASILILLSFMMSNPVKLRIIAFIGAASFSVYGFLIHSYPTAIMNAGVTLVNIYYLIKIFNSSDTYCVCKANVNDDLLKNFLNLNLSKIKNIYKNFDINSNQFDLAYIIMCNSDICGMLLGNKNETSVDNAVLFTTIKQKNNNLYKELYKKLALDGYCKIIVNLKDINDKCKNYLSKINFKELNENLIKIF